MTNDYTTKGLTMMNEMSAEDKKQYRQEVIEFVRGCIGRGYNYSMMVTALTTKYEVSVRAAKKYIKYTKEDIQKRKQANQQDEYDMVCIKLEVLYRDLYAEGKLIEAAKVLKQLVDLKGYEAPKAHLIKQETTVHNSYENVPLEILMEVVKRLEDAEAKQIENE